MNILPKEAYLCHLIKKPFMPNVTNASSMKLVLALGENRYGTALAMRALYSIYGLNLSDWSEKQLEGAI
jgi:hypothetical protein